MLARTSMVSMVVRESPSRKLATRNQMFCHASGGDLPELFHEDGHDGAEEKDLPAQRPQVRVGLHLQGPRAVTISASKQRNTPCANNKRGRIVVGSQKEPLSPRTPRE